MSAINQYINLYRDNREAIDAHSAPVLNALRQDALGALDGKRLPERGDEGYEKTSIEAMMAPDYGVNINRVNIPVDIAASFKCGVPNMSTLVSFIVNDTFVPSSTLKQKLPQGMIVDSLSHAARQYSELVAAHYGKIADINRPAVALNTLLAQDGIFIYLPQGLKVEKPLQLVNIFNAPVPMMGVRRMLIIVEEDASLQMLVCDHTQNQETAYLSNQVIEISLGRNAKLDLYDIEESSESTSRFSQLFARQESGSNLLVNGTTLVGGNTRNNYDIDIMGEHCETLLSGMAIGSGKQHTDNCSNVNHRAPRCHSNQLFKYVLDDESTGAFEGSILVTPQAQFTEAYQSNRNILASTKARMHTKPQLEIYNDDVKCSHGATTGQLDANALFYMRTRGIPEKQARTMLMQAFMTDVIDTVRMDGLNDRMRHLVERRFVGRRELCGDCPSSTNSNSN